MRGCQHRAELAKLARNTKEEIRLAAVQVLAAIGDRAATDPLVQALRDKSGSIRAEAAVGLTKLDSAKAKRELMGILRKRRADYTVNGHRSHLRVLHCSG